MRIEEPNAEEKLLILGSEFRLARSRFWCTLISGIIVWPILILAAAAWSSMSNIRLQAKLIGAKDDEWMTEASQLGSPSLDVTA